MGPTCSPRLNFPRDKFPLSSRPSGPTDPSSPSSYVQNPSEALVASARPFPEPNENQFYQSNTPKRETSQTEAKRVATRVGITSQTSHTSCYQSGHLTRIKQNRIVSLASKQKQDSPRPVLLLFDTFPSFVIALLLPLSLSPPAPQPSIVLEPRTLAPELLDSIPDANFSSGSERVDKFSLRGEGVPFVAYRGVGFTKFLWRFSLENFVSPQLTHRQRRAGSGRRRKTGTSWQERYRDQYYYGPQSWGSTLDIWLVLG